MAISAVDENGFPILLADVPNAGSARVDPDAKSGNPQHDIRSGKFAPGSAQGDPEQNVPANTDAQAYLRQLDAVRDIAREMDDIESGDIQDLLAGRLTRPLEQAELEAFLVQVRQQRLNDFVDLLDYQLRNLIDTIKRGRRRVRVAAPKGWIRRTFNRLSDEEILSVINRLEARGHKREDLQRSILGRIRKKGRAEKLGARLAEIPENDETLELSLGNSDYDEELDDHIDSQILLANALEKISDKQEQPIVVNVNVENKPTKKIVKRDSKGNIETVEEVQI